MVAPNLGALCPHGHQDPDFVCVKHCVAFCDRIDNLGVAGMTSSLCSYLKKELIGYVYKTVFIVI